MQQSDKHSLNKLTMLRFSFSILFILSLSIINSSCRSTTKEVNTSSEYDSTKNIVLGINSEQQKLFRQFSTKDERAKKYKEFCHDSLITIAGYGNFLYNAVDASKDLVDGYADTIHDIHLKIYGNTAILTGKAKMFTLINKDTLYEDIAISKVFMNFNGAWKMVLRSSGPLAINYHKSRFVNQETLLKYQGNYGLPGESVDTFRVDGNKLYLFDGQNNSKVMYYALNDSTFFEKDDLSFLVFRTNSRGVVDHMDWTLPDGQIFEIPKM